MQKILFIDRDGTIIKEPPEDFQVDSLEKLEFIPAAISNLKKIKHELEYLFVMITNQDGLGTDSFPEETFLPAHNKMLKTLEGEGVVFDEILIDKSFEEDKLPTRKPGIGLLMHYLNSNFDLENSYVIGDRTTDVLLAKNIGSKSIFFGKENDEASFVAKHWNDIYNYLRLPDRIGKVIRKTNETDIKIEMNLDGSGRTQITTGLSFFDHMLDQIGRHAGIDLIIDVQGDLNVDEHHTIEDTALALGEAFLQALGDKKGISRYGFLLPMDDSLAQVALDFGGRPWLVWEANFKREKIGDVPTEMFYHFFKSFSDASKSNLNIRVEGNNEHHKIEAIFKALAKCIKIAVNRNEDELNRLPSTKGML